MFDVLRHNELILYPLISLEIVDISSLIAQEICPSFPDDCLDDVNKAVEVLKSPIIKKIPVVRASNLPGNFFWQIVLLLNLQMAKQQHF